MNSQKDFANIVLIVVIVTIVAVGGYFMFVKKSVTPSTATNQQQTNNPVTPTAQDTMANWKTYRSDRYDFEIKYPNDWEIIDGGSSPIPYFHVVKSRTQVATGTKITLNPQGRTGHGPASETRKVTLDLTAAEEGNVLELFLSNNQETWGYIVYFVNAPETWSGAGLFDEGSIWAVVESEGMKNVCRDRSKTLENCSSIEVGLDMVGNVNAENFNTVKKILSTFRFTK